MEMCEVKPSVFQSLCSVDVTSMLQYTVAEIRPVLPCLTRMLLCSSVDESASWQESRKDLMRLLSGIEDVNDIVALLSVDFPSLEAAAKIERQMRLKVHNDGSILTSLPQKHGILLEFERSEPARKLQILLSEIMPLIDAFSNLANDDRRLPNLDGQGYATNSELFSCPSYLEVVSDVFCIAAMELPSLMNMVNLAETLIYVPNGVKVLCKLVANCSSSILPVCRALIKNHDSSFHAQSRDVLKCIEQRRVYAVETLCSLKPDIAMNVRSMTVHYCKLPGLAVSLVLKNVKTPCNENTGCVSELVAFVSGLLLGSKPRIRSWFALYIKTNQEVQPNRLRKELEKELQSIAVSTEQEVHRSQPTMDDDPVLHNMCLLSEEECLRATTLIRLCCALKAIAGLKFSQVETDLVLRLITCFPPLTASGIRFMSLSLSMLLACSALISGPEKETRSINWIKWLASRSSELQNAGPEGGSFAEQLLLMAIHLHSDQRNAVVQLACSTLGMRIKVPAASLTRMRHIFTEEVFTTQVVAAHAVIVPVTHSLNAAMTGYIPIHCVYQLLKSRAFSRSQVSIKTWIYEQICSTSIPLHPQLPRLIKQYVSTIVTPYTKGHSEGMLNNPLTEEEVLIVFQDQAVGDDKYSLTTQLLILYYVLLYEDSVLSHMKSIISLPNAPKRYSSNLMNGIPVNLLLHRAQRNPKSCNSLYPSLLGLLAVHMPHLCQVEDWISELDTLPVGKNGSSFHNSSGKKQMKACSPQLLLKGLLHADVNPAMALIHLRALTSSRFSAPDTIPYACSLTKGLPKLLEEDVSMRVKQEACKLWLKMNSVMPRKLWVLTCNALQPTVNSHGGLYIKEEVLKMDDLVENPLLILALNGRVFRSPEIFSVILRMLNACLAASRVHFLTLVKSNPSVPSTPSIPSHSDNASTGSPFVTDTEKEDLCIALVSAQVSASVQILIEVCSTTADEWKISSDNFLAGGKFPNNLLLSSWREVHCLVCCFLHQMFIADPSVAKLVHFQGYPKELIPVLVSGVPSMHICLDFIPEMLQIQNVAKQLFATQLASHLSTHYPLPKSLSIARLSVNVLSTLITVLPAHQHCEFFSVVLSSLRRFALAFPPLVRDCLGILIHLARISYCHVSVHDVAVARYLDFGPGCERVEARFDDANVRLFWDARRTFSDVVTDALYKFW